MALTTQISLRREAAIAAACLTGYFGVRHLVWNERGRRRATRNATRIVETERRFKMAVEPAIQRLTLRSPRLVQVANLSYAVGNLGLSIGWLIALHARNDPRFLRERRAIVTAFVGALPVFLAFPAAPPRSREDHTDTLLNHGINLEHQLLVRFYNPIAAMPSHHVAFAVVSGFGLAHSSSNCLTGSAWVAYPGAVASVVLATGNHYVFDVVAGAALGTLARFLTR